MSRGGWTLIILAAAVAAWFAFGHHLGQTTAKPVERPLKVYAPVPKAAPLNGVAWQITHVYKVVEKARTIIPQIANLGADTIMISAARYQENAVSPVLFNDPEKMPSAEQWREIFAVAHANNLRVVLMPIVLLSEPRGTEWRGEIKPPNWDVWFASYEDYILDMAKLAAANGVEVMTVGSELVSTEKYGDRWKRLIASVRKVFDGKLSYSANWDHYRHIEFWDDLDYVGMTTYHKLASEAGPALEALIDAWKPIKDEILTWQATVGKPILFTEVGWCSQEGASVEAWNYYHKQEATEAGQEEQRRLYVAFMETWRDVPEVGGAIWWEWSEAKGGPDDFNYTPRGKPAEKELSRWFRQRRDSLARPNAPTTSQTAGERASKTEGS
ncbi:MAG: hypothetical protein JXA69_12185 [Phycisphaerae bacterium]|nr:hypothetical protein [Phycisphaerae bacterium]